MPPKGQEKEINERFVIYPLSRGLYLSLKRQTKMLISCRGKKCLKAVKTTQFCFVRNLIYIFSMNYQLSRTHYTQIRHSCYKSKCITQVKRSFKTLYWRQRQWLSPFLSESHETDQFSSMSDTAQICKKLLSVFILIIVYTDTEPILPLVQVLQIPTPSSFGVLMLIFSFHFKLRLTPFNMRASSDPPK